MIRTCWSIASNIAIFWTCLNCGTKDWKQAKTNNYWTSEISQKPPPKGIPKGIPLAPPSTASWRIAGCEVSGRKDPTDPDSATRPLKSMKYAMDWFKGRSTNQCFRPFFMINRFSQFMGASGIFFATQNLGPVLEKLLKSWNMIFL